MGLKDIIEESNCKTCKQISTCFKKLNNNELEYINPYKKQLSYKKGETICKQGAFSSNILYLAKGTIKIHMEGSGPKNVNIDILEDNSFLDLSIVFKDSTNFNFTAIAMENSTVCTIDKTRFNELLDSNIQFSKEIIKWNTKKINRLYETLHSHVHKQMHGKLAISLLYLTDDIHFKTDILSKLSRKDLAEFSNISTESTVRILSEFKKEHIIDQEGKKIKVLDRDTLYKISVLG